MLLNYINNFFFIIVYANEDTMKDLLDGDLVKKGKMVKAPWTMTEKERAEWERRTQEEAKDYLFSIGQPLVYEKDGQMIAEHADGRVETLQ